MDLTDIVSLLDRKYSDVDAIPCANEGLEVKMQCGQKRTEHGILGVHKSGAYLVCGVCGYNQPVARP